MNTPTLKILGSSLVLIAGMSTFGLARAHGDDTHDAIPASKAEAAHDESAVQKIPETLEGIWHAIDQHTAELDKLIQSGALAEVHHHAFAIRDLFAALPEHSQDLNRSGRNWLVGYVKYMPTLAQRLDESADAKDKPETQANFKKLKDILEKMRAHYPELGKKSAVLGGLPPPPSSTRLLAARSASVSNAGASAGIPL